jgi:hypothetical protein
MRPNTRRGDQIDSTCAVFIEYEQDDRGNFRIATLGEDDWGDRAVVVGTERCDEHSDCHLITVIAPGTITAREEVHALTSTHYAVETS